MANGLGYGEGSRFRLAISFDSEFGVCQRSQSAPHCSRNQLGLPSSPDGGGGITDEGEKHVGPADAQYEIRALPANAWSRRLGELTTADSVRWRRI